MKLLPLILLLCFGTLARGFMIYDVNFSAQTDNVGAPATVGGSGPPFARPTQKNFGTSRVLTSYNSLTDRPLQLIPQPIGSFSYSQYQFNVSSFDAEPFYQLDFDLVLKNMAPSPGHILSSDPNHDVFTILFDTPTSTRIDFWDAGRISQNGQQIGTFLQDQAFHFSVLLDLPNNRWTITEDSNQLFFGQFFRTYPAQPTPPMSLGAIRINLADSVVDAGQPFAAIDNIKILGSQGVPEPTTLFFCIASAFVLLARRR